MDGLVMRRPRHKLEVSTFPFLAVLLCAMGSLILFLLVMDRRAKLVARNKAREAYEAQLAQRDAVQRERQAEQERRRLQIHQVLATQHRQIAGEAEAVKRQLAEADQKLQAHEAGYLDLEQQLAREQD